MKVKLHILLIIISLCIISCNDEKNGDSSNVTPRTVNIEQTDAKTYTPKPDTSIIYTQKRQLKTIHPEPFTIKHLQPVKSGKPTPVKFAQKTQICKPGKDGFFLPEKIQFNIDKKLYPMPSPITSSPMKRSLNTPYFMRFLDVEQGINTSDIIFMLEDSRGHLWFGSEGAGVSRYDGHSFLHYNTSKGITRLIVTCALEDSKGNIWFGTNGGGICIFDGIYFKHLTEKEGFHNLVYSIIEDRNKNIWIATRDGIFQFDGNDLYHYSKKQGLPDSWILSMKEDHTGNIWLGCVNGRIVKYTGSEFVIYPEFTNIINAPVKAIVEDKDNNLWFGTFGKGILKYNGKRFLQISENQGLASNQINDLVIDDHGNLWIATENAGASMLNGTEFREYSAEQGLKTNRVKSIMEDSKGNIWFGTYDGATLYNPGSFINYSLGNGFKADSVTSIVEDQVGNIWIGSNGDGLVKYSGNSFYKYTTQEGLCSNYIQSLLIDHSNDLWIGNKNAGVACLNNKTITTYRSDDGFEKQTISFIMQDKSDNMWFGTYGNGASKKEGKRLINYNKDGGLSNNYVWSMLQDNNLNYWITTRYNGANRLNKEFTRFAKDEGLTNNSIYCSILDRNNTIWFGTMNSGIIKFNQQFFTQYSEADGLASNTVYSLIEDKKGGVWAGTDKGISLIQTNKDKTITVSNFGLEDGLNEELFLTNAVCLDKNEQLWWGTNKGVTSLNLKEFQLSKTAPVVHLNSISIEQEYIDYPKLRKDRQQRMVSKENNSQLNFNKIKYSGIRPYFNYPENLVLPYYINNLTFHFSAIDWTAPQSLEYQFYIEGLDRGWREISTENIADYRNLPFGHFTFKVRAKGVANKWSKTLEYHFTIKPPWWKSNLAYIAYIIIFALTIYILTKYREKALKEEKVRLEQKVEERTHEVIEKNEELKQQNEEIISQRDEIEAQRNMAFSQKEQIEQQNESITDSINYARRIQSAMLPPESYITELLHENFIFYKPKDIVSGDFYWVKQVNQYIVITAADCTGHGVPGAFMSMLGISFLNEIVQKREITQANQVLNELRKQIKYSLRQHGGKDATMDGIDMALCVLDTKSNKMQYAGAFNPLILITYEDDKPKLVEIKADRMPVGFFQGRDKTFTNHEIQLEMGDTFYLFSDGFMDQMGGPNGKKFMSKNFKELLLKIHDEPMYQQKEILNDTINNWMKDTDQMDDILVIGVRI